MADKYIGKPVYVPLLKHCYREHEYKSKKVHQEGSKSKKKHCDYELGVLNTTAVKNV